MPSIAIRLDPAKLAHATADIRYEIPALLVARSGGLISEDGYDYEPVGDALQIYLRTSDLARALPLVVALLESERFDGDDLSAAAEIGISDDDAANAAAFRIVYPRGRAGTIVPPPPPLPTPSVLAALEKTYAFRFPPAFHDMVNNPPAALRRLLPRARFVVPHEVRTFRRAGCGDKLLPFLVEPQPAHEDYYCFDLATTPPEYAVTVFSVHITVADWPNLAAWLAWVEERAALP